MDHLGRLTGAKAESQPQRSAVSASNVSGTPLVPPDELQSIFPFFYIRSRHDSLTWTILFSDYPDAVFYPHTRIAALGS